MKKLLILLVVASSLVWFACESESTIISDIIISKEIQPNDVSISTSTFVSKIANDAGMVDKITVQFLEDGTAKISKQVEEQEKVDYSTVNKFNENAPALSEVKQEDIINSGDYYFVSYDGDVIKSLIPGYRIECRCVADYDDSFGGSSGGGDCIIVGSSVVTCERLTCSRCQMFLIRKNDDKKVIHQSGIVIKAESVQLID